VAGDRGIRLNPDSERGAEYAAATFGDLAEELAAEADVAG
jgi:hypothetical protein